MAFPPNPKDGTVAEVGSSLYRYVEKDRSWIRVDGLLNPGLATPQTDGAMPKEDFQKIMGLLLPPPRITLTSPNCGVTFDQGVVSLRSLDESLGITANPNVLNKIAGVPATPTPWQLHENTYGYDFTVNIDQLIEEVNNRGKLRYKKTKGPQGPQGERGDSGIDRLDTGPQGAIGDAGANAPFDGILTPEDISFVPADPSANRGVISVAAEMISATENYLVVSRATIGNPNACPKLVRPKNQNSPWLLIADIPPGQCFPRSADCPTACGTRLYYVDVTTILQLLQERYEKMARDLKASKEALVLGWMRTMISVFNEQKNAICCALENCQSRSRNQDFRDKIDQARIQAAQRDLKLIVQGPGKDLVEMDPGKACSLPGGGADVVQNKCGSIIQAISNGWVSSPDGFLPVDLANIPPMNLPAGGPWPDAPTAYNLAVQLEQGLYRAKIIDCCPVNIGDDGLANLGGSSGLLPLGSDGIWRRLPDMVGGLAAPIGVALPNNQAIFFGNGCEFWDGNTKTWTSHLFPNVTPGMSQATLMATGEILITGDDPPSKDALGNWVPSSGINTMIWSNTPTFTFILPGYGAPPLTNMAESRQAHSSTLLQDGRVLVAGGCRIVKGINGFTTLGLATAEIFDPTTRTWTSTGSLSKARRGAPPALLNDGRVLIVDGNEAEIWDPNTGTWTMVASIPPIPDPTKLSTQWPPSQNGSELIKLDDGRILCYNQGDVFIYDPATNSWEVRAHPTLLTGGLAEMLPNGRILAMGGRDYTGGATYKRTGLFSVADTPRTSFIYDPIQDAWSDVLWVPYLGGDLTTAISMTTGDVIVAGTPHYVSLDPRVAGGSERMACIFSPSASNAPQQDPNALNGALPTVHKSRKIQLAYNSGANYLVLGQIKDYGKEIANLGGVDRVLNQTSAAWPKFHNMMNSDPANHQPVLFSHNGGWVGSFINHDHPFTKTGPNDSVVEGPATILIEDMECACSGTPVVLDPQIHSSGQFNQNIGVRVDGLQAAEYVIEITGCCGAYGVGLYSGAFRYTQQMMDGTYKTTSVVVPSGQPYPNEDAFPTLPEAEAAYLGLRHSLSHPGGPLWLWINDNTVEDNFGTTTLLIKDTLCFEQNIQGSEATGAAPLIPNNCEMAATQVEWYERGWRIEECCAAWVTLNGVQWIVVKRSIGVDVSCGGGESANTPCLRKFIDAGVGHPAIAWPTLDGIEFEGRPTSGTVTFYYDQSISDQLLQKIKSGQSLKTIGDPMGIELILTPAIP